MNSRERVLAALNMQIPDKVPFFDYFDDNIRRKLAGEDALDEAKFAKAIKMDAIYIEDYCAPFFCESHTQTTPDNHEREYIGEGLIKSEKALSLMTLPDPHDESYYDAAKKFVEQYGDSDLALYAALRPFGLFTTIFSMGYIDFSYALYENRSLVEEVFDRYMEWNMVVVEKLQQCGFDFLVCYNDMAYRSGPMISPQIFRELFLPKMQVLANTIKLPWAFHSDGDLTMVFDDLLTLNMNAINPIEPGAMDIYKIKEKYGKQVCLWGNVDLRYTLTQGTPDEAAAETKDLIEKIGKDGGYILASANSITDYCKPENVWAMINAKEQYGVY